MSARSRDANGVFFALLGALEVVDGDRPIPLRAPKQRALLALLLLRRGEQVAVEGIAEELWAGEPPATGTKAVRVYVGELRKALGAEVIVTQGRSYAIPVEGHETDVERFEGLAAEGRERLDRGDAEGAARKLREALGVWRGPALADFRYDDFAQHEIVRLEEARIAVLEARIDADLALGREHELVPELQALVGEHPLRERLRGQLMLALYRSGRQTEALEVHREGRRRLVEELGLEPVRELQELERAILAQDESIGVPQRRLLLRRVRRRPALIVGFGGFLVVAAAATALAISLTRPGGGGISSVVQGNSLAAIDPATGRIVAEVPVGATPSAVAVGGGAVWVLNADDQTISRVDAETKEVRTFAIGATPTDLAAGTGGVWVGNGGKLARAQFAGTTAVALTRLDAHTGAVLANVPLPERGSTRSNVAQNHIAPAGGSVWAIAPDFSLVRIDPRRDKVSAVARGVAAVAVAAERGGVWIVSDTGMLERISATSDRVTARVNVPATALSELAVGDGSVWATDPYQGTLWRIDPGARAVERTIDVGAGADSVAFGAGAVWVANSLQGTLSQVDPGTNRIRRVIPLGSTPRAVAVGEGLVWIAVAGQGAVAAAAQRQSGQTIRALPATICGPLVSGSEPARFIVVSDLPLRGGPRFVTPQMSAAILHVLRRHAFRAGRYPLGYQSCDDATAQTGLFDERKCAENTKAYAANRDVIGVVGPYNSGCAYAEIPIASRAGLPIVSPTNSDVGLTRPAFGAPRGAFRALYPTGRRTYVRLMSPDDAQAAADALLARSLGARRLFVLDDGGYGTAFAAYFTRAAGRLGLRVVGAARWNPQKPRLREVAAHARPSGAQAVFLCGLIDTGAGEMLAALRRALPPSVPVIGCDGLLPVSLLFERTGPAARGTYVSIDGLVNERLGPAGRKFLRDFGSTQPGAKVDVAAAYAAQAAELLLDAIARSDGTRASVSAELFRARVRGGLLGDIEIDAVGDPIPAPVTIVRLEHGGGTNVVASHEGARVFSVITPPPRLLGHSG
jgi:DNA-binding SARP family transcriptional activator/ABC-type branched-subunit amino acid transport system substrate-binding protein/DNA-binding beta-propeller fold protein YncE